MKILYVSADYAPNASGADISAHSLLSGLGARGFNIIALIDERLRQRTDSHYRDETGVSFRYTADADLELTLDGLRTTLRPDVVMTQGLWLDRMLDWSASREVPLIWFVRSMEHNDCVHAIDAARPTWLVANSPAVADYISRVWNRDSVTLLPLIEPAEFLAPERTPDGTVTLINPVAQKGGALFSQLATSCPERAFRAVRGWRQDGLAKPVYVEMPANVTVDGPFTDMRQVYAGSRLLLVPSVWEEAFGRVVVEAMINGIPVLVSDRGALPWLVGDAGTVVSADSPEAWQKALEAYDDPAVYEAASRKGIERARMFHPERLIDEFASRLRLAEERGWPAH
ncbi:glycosyltransferase [Streptomyces sp. SID8361]|uniref:glycosyltransferase family 4 protein n=1 Tax=Streptomyces sp. MnatMP-M27 TaxID=1839768 RepID=UPI00081DFA12|nr:glycosyltransferase family 4 protein [Streptomyces sp. MnatMP-M27]MYU12637.1 glycosyltransferase [Streptomyces sp. SID8361]SCF93586.1 Glycosyl transferases group 1 [Streptomyces sp. MnatMP-M27]